MVAHDLVVILLRYLFEGLDKAQVLEICGKAGLLNYGITYYQLHEHDGLLLHNYNAVIDYEGRMENADA
jgi:hypothetical protein